MDLYLPYSYDNPNPSVTIFNPYTFCLLKTTSPSSSCLDKVLIRSLRSSFFCCFLDSVSFLYCANSEFPATIATKMQTIIFFTSFDLDIQRKFRANLYNMTSSIVYEGNLRTVCTHLQSNSQIQTDAPLDNQGRGERFSPTDLLATSLGACALTIMGIKARDLNVDIAGTKIDIQKIMKADPRRVGGINLTFHFPETVFADEKQRLRTCCVRSPPMPKFAVL